MSNWFTLSFVYNFRPSLYNYINLKFHHFQFCSKDDYSITASIYLDNLAGEIKNDIAEQKSVNKKSLIFAFVKRILENKEAKLQMILLFEKKQMAVDKEEIKRFLNQANLLLNPSTEPELIIQEPLSQPEQTTQSEDITQPELIADKEERIPNSKLFARTYVIAAHIFLEINNNESHYEELMWDIAALKEFITEKFKVSKIASTIDDMKGFSYKDILSGKKNGNVKAQLNSQIKQIAKNPAIFGADVSAFAEHILKDNSSF